MLVSSQNQQQLSKTTSPTGKHFLFLYPNLFLQIRLHNTLTSYSTLIMQCLLHIPLMNVFQPVLNYENIFHLTIHNSSLNVNLWCILGVMVDG